MVTSVLCTLELSPISDRIPRIQDVHIVPTGFEFGPAAFMRQGHASGSDSVKRGGQLKLAGCIFKPHARPVRHPKPRRVVRVQGDSGPAGALLNIGVVGVRVVESPARGRAQQAEAIIRRL